MTPMKLLTVKRPSCAEVKLYGAGENSVGDNVEMATTLQIRKSLLVIYRTHGNFEAPPVLLSCLPAKRNTVHG